MELLMLYIDIIVAFFGWMIILCVKAKRQGMTAKEKREIKRAEQGLKEFYIELAHNNIIWKLKNDGFTIDAPPELVGTSAEAEENRKKIKMLTCNTLSYNGKTYETESCGCKKKFKEII